MNELLGKYCLNNEKQNGLLLIDMPTGTGKTYNAVKFVYNNYQKCKGKVIYNSRHIWMHTAKIVMQAIGRICRTKNKNSNIYIDYDVKLEKDLCGVKNELLNRPLNHEFKKLLN